MTRSDRLARVAAPVVVALLLLGAWELLVAVFDVKPYVLPAPTAIATQVRENLSGIF
ncbi:MAG: ABC transporter permease, partial [Actinomycetota bacterium]|nr:ABC transporter permease [Actinomycetota bacterium]